MDSTAAGRFQRAALGPRTLTAVVGIPLLLAALWAGGPWWIALMAAITVIGAGEFTQLHGLHPSRAAVMLLLIAGLFAVGAAGGRAMGAALAVIWLFEVTTNAARRLSAPRPRPWPALPVLPDAPVWLLFGPLYLAVPTALLARWRLQLPPESILAFLLIIWANDTAAYFVGIAAGRHKLAPKISPGKSWEGAIAGTAAGALVAALASSWLGLPVGRAVALGILVTIASQIGDLFESAMKRKAGVKDSGTILPGHGGILDRFDGILLAAPVAYVLVRLWGGR